MKKLIPFLISSILVAGAFGCQEAPKTGSETPSTNEASSVPAKPAADTTQTTTKTEKPTTDAKATTKTETPTTDAKATTKTETPTTDAKATTKTEKPAATKATSDLKTEVSKKLQESLPNNKLVVENKAGEIILKGTAASKEELTKAETLAKGVKGVKTVKVEAKVEPAKKI